MPVTIGTRVPASTSFFMPLAVIDPFGAQTTITYWASSSSNYYLLPLAVTDAVGNAHTVQIYHWETLQPAKMQDANDNLSEIQYDILGLPIAMALMGKGTEGDYLLNSDGTAIDPYSSTDSNAQANFWGTATTAGDPETNAPILLGRATWRCIYDFNVQPWAVAMIAREQHCTPPLTTPATKLLIRISYTDGIGRVAMHKAQAAPDPVTSVARWIGSGKTVYNNKGKVVLQYEPYFSPTFAYDPALQAASLGVSPRIHYDPLDRVVRTDLPDGSYTMVTFDAWQQFTYDNNDTVALPAIDPATGLPITIYSAWYKANKATTASSEQHDAADKAFAHANTPTVTWLDTLSRPFYTRQYLVDMQTAITPDVDFFDSNIVLDIQGDRIAVYDAMGKNTLSYSYNMLKAPIKTVSKDSGTSLLFMEAVGQPLYTWDADDRRFHITYDLLRRPKVNDVTLSGATVPKVLTETKYGDELTDITDAMANNLRERPYLIYDGAGIQNIAGYDFKGNLLNTTRQYVSDVTQSPDWKYTSGPGSPGMEIGVYYATSFIYDALNRPMSLTTPDDGTTNYTYEQSGQLYKVDVSSVHSLSTDIINTILYNAKGQRTKVQYENGATTTYIYDADTFRVVQIRTTRSSDSAILQDLRYWYDPVGNITIQEDQSTPGLYIDDTNTIDPTNNYTYDALYRLIIANGREYPATAATSYNDGDRISKVPIPYSIGMRQYVQYYTYDRAGNMIEQRHTTTTSADNWTRSFGIDTVSNRLHTNSIGSNTVYSETYTYDNRGNIKDGFSHLAASNALIYNENNHLQQVTNAGGAIITYYQYDGGGQRVRKVTVDSGSNITQVRKYVGEWELYTQNDSTSLLIQRETLHIMDNSSRVAMIDTPIAGSSIGSEVQLLRYQFSNQLSTATLELDDTGSIISYEEYYAYGSTSFQSGRTLAEVSLKRYRYTGKERDEETGFYYHGARYYVPWLCRWMAVDPLENKYTPQSPYVYCSDNSIKKIDPDGRDEKEQGVKGYNGLSKPKSGSADDVKDAEKFEGAKAALNESPTFNALLKKFNTGDFKNVGLSFEAKDDDEMGSTSNTVVLGETQIMVQVGRNTPIPLASYSGDGSDITKFSLNIKINKTIDTPYLAAVILNHELTIHADKLAQIIAGPGSINEKYQALRLANPTEQHGDIRNLNSTYNRVNVQMLEHLATAQDYKLHKPLLASGDSVLSYGRPQILPNASSFNRMVMILNGTPGDDSPRSRTPVSSARDGIFNFIRQTFLPH